MENDKKDILKGWILVIVSVVFMVVYFIFTYSNLKTPTVEKWNYGTTRFVPNSSPYAVEQFNSKMPKFPTVKKNVKSGKKTEGVKK
jgi:hypothetical protein